MRPSKISLNIRPVWSEASLCAQSVAKNPSFLHADSEDSDQTRRMHRLIWAFAGCKHHFVGFVMGWLIFLLVTCAKFRLVPTFEKNIFHFTLFYYLLLLASCWLRSRWLKGLDTLSKEANISELFYVWLLFGNRLLRKVCSKKKTIAPFESKLFPFRGDWTPFQNSNSKSQSCDPCKKW